MKQDREGRSDGTELEIVIYLHKSPELALILVFVLKVENRVPDLKQAQTDGASSEFTVLIGSRCRDSTFFELPLIISSACSQTLLNWQRFHCLSF